MPSLALADAAPPIEPVEVPQVRCLGSLQWIAHEKDLVYGNLLISFVCRNGMEWDVCQMCSTVQLCKFRDSMGSMGSMDCGQGRGLKPPPGRETIRTIPSQASESSSPTSVTDLPQEAREAA